MINRAFIFAFLSILHLEVKGQNNTEPAFPQAIEDNSYFIEEAYNQEDRVVQHINNARLSFTDSHDLVYSFTQEWPVFSQKHQFSYTLGFASLNSFSVTGFSDFMLNYRYQMTGHNAPVTLAPRLSLIIPTGNADRQLGNGVLGYQVNLPASKRISGKLVVHLNAGYTLLPRVKYTDPENHIYRNTYSAINTGASLIWLMTYRTNIMFEGVYNILRQNAGSPGLVTFGQAIISPGIRHAFDIKDLQIVPGIAVPFLIQKNHTETGIFFYLSFEHPF